MLIKKQFICHTVTFQLLERVFRSEAVLFMFALVLFVYEIIYGPQTFSDACFNFLHLTFPNLQDNEIHFVNIRLSPPCQLCIQSVINVSGTFFAKKESVSMFSFRSFSCKL